MAKKKKTRAEREAYVWKVRRHQDKKYPDVEPVWGPLDHKTDEDFDEFERNTRGIRAEMEAEEARKKRDQTLEDLSKRPKRGKKDRATFERLAGRALKNVKSPTESAMAKHYEAAKAKTRDWLRDDIRKNTPGPKMQSYEGMTPWEEHMARRRVGDLPEEIDYDRIGADAEAELIGRELNALPPPEGLLSPIDAEVDRISRELAATPPPEGLFPGRPQRRPTPPQYVPPPQPPMPGNLQGPPAPPGYQDPGEFQNQGPPAPPGYQDPGQNQGPPLPAHMQNQGPPAPPGYQDPVSLDSTLGSAVGQGGGPQVQRNYSPAAPGYGAPPVQQIQPSFAGQTLAATLDPGHGYYLQGRTHGNHQVPVWDTDNPDDLVGYSRPNSPYMEEYASPGWRAETASELTGIPVEYLNGLGGQEHWATETYGARKPINTLDQYAQTGLVPYVGYRR